MKKVILSTLLLVFIIGFSACEKIEIGKNIPKCIEKKIKKEEPMCLAFVGEYIYKNKGEIQSRVYKFYYGLPACMLQEIVPPTYYDEQCNLIDVIINENGNIEYNNAIYRHNRYVYQYYEKK